MTLAEIQSKLVAAQQCHPNAVQPLIAEALDAIDEMARADAPAGPQPAAILPAFLGVAKQKLDDLVARGFRISGFAVERDGDDKGPTRGFITMGGLVGWWTPDTQAELDQLRAQVEALTKERNKLLRDINGGEPENGEMFFMGYAELVDSLRAQVDELTALIPTPAPLTRPADADEIVRLRAQVKAMMKPQKPFAWARDWDEGETDCRCKYRVVFDQHETDESPGWTPLFFGINGAQEQINVPVSIKLDFKQCLDLLAELSDLSGPVILRPADENPDHGFYCSWRDRVKYMGVAKGETIPNEKTLTRPAVPEGWKLVPIKADPKMLAVFDASDGFFVRYNKANEPAARYEAVSRETMQVVGAFATDDEADALAARLSYEKHWANLLAAAPQPEAQPTDVVKEVGVAIPGWTESDALAILNRISDGPFGQADVDDALEFMRHVDDQRQMKILAAVDEAQPTEAAQPSLMSIINAQADEHAKRSPLDGAAQKGGA